MAITLGCGHQTSTTLKVARDYFQTLTYEQTTDLYPRSSDQTVHFFHVQPAHDLPCLKKQSRSIPLP